MAKEGNSGVSDFLSTARNFDDAEWEQIFDVWEAMNRDLK